MSKDVVRQIRFKPVHQDSEPDGMARMTPTPPQSDLQTIIDLHKHSCHFTEAKMDIRLAQPFPTSFIISPDPEVNRLNAWQIFAQQMTLEISDIASFVAKLPRFDTINRRDVTILLQKNAFLVYFLRSLRALSSEGLLLRDGSLMDSETLKLMYGSLADEMLRVAREIVSFGTTDSEIAVFITLMLVQPLTAEYQIATDFTSNAQLVQMNDFFRRTFYQMMSETPDGLKRFHSLMAFIQPLIALNRDHELVINEVVRANESFLHLPQIFREYFKLPFPETHNQENQMPPQRAPVSSKESSEPSSSQSAYHIDIEN